MESIVRGQLVLREEGKTAALRTASETVVRVSARRDVALVRRRRIQFAFLFLLLFQVVLFSDGQQRLVRILLIAGFVLGRFDI